MVLNLIEQHDRLLCLTDNEAARPGPTVLKTVCNAEIWSGERDTGTVTNSWPTWQTQFKLQSLSILQ